MNKRINNFNGIAHLYDVLSRMVFRNALKKSQLHFIHQIPSRSNVLIVGGGTGWYLYELIHLIPCKKIVYIEASSEMVALSKKKIASLSSNVSIEWIEGSIEEFVLQEKFDVIVTNFVLDLFTKEKLKTVMNTLHSSLKEDGIWLFTDFKINYTSGHKHWQRLFIKIMFGFFKYVAHVENDRLLPFTDFFQNLRLKKIESKDFFSAMIESAVYKK